MVDVGCGIGGSSRHIARKYGCEAVRGITLSPKQAQRANDITAAEGLADTVSFQVAGEVGVSERGGEGGVWQGGVQASLPYCCVWCRGRCSLRPAVGLHHILC